MKPIYGYRFAVQSVVFLAMQFVVGCTSTSTDGVTGDVEQVIPLPAELESKLLANMVKLRGGTFIMGSDHEAAMKRETPAHQVTVSDFYIGKYEVTQTLFKAVMGWDQSYFPCDGCPVNHVSFLNVALFIERLNAKTGKTFRLPTEAEWEYAARGGQHSKGFLFSGSDDIESVAWYAGNARRKLHAVGQKQPNELGLYDMTGNVWELCQDDLNPNAYSKKHRVNPREEVIAINDVVLKVTRGGGYEYSPEESFVFRRDGVSDNVRLADLGFRLVMEVQ